MTMKKVRKLGDSSAQLQELLGLDFRPTETQREAKAKFWAVINHTADFGNPENMEWIDIARVCAVPAVTAWSNAPGFSDWFFNKFESEQRIETLWTLALDSMEAILRNDDPRVQSARVNVIKLVSEMRDTKRKPDFLDKKIQEMSLEELTVFIEKQQQPKRLKEPENND